MIWFVLGYFVLAMVMNLTTAFVTARIIMDRCDHDVNKFKKVMDNNYAGSDEWLEQYIPLPPIFTPLIKMIFFPFNVATILHCYKNACDEIEKENEDA